MKVTAFNGSPRKDGNSVCLINHVFAALNAEGIETDDIAQWLKRERVDMMQGYFFGKPSFERPWAQDKTVAPPVASPKFTVIAGNTPQQTAATRT